MMQSARFVNFRSIKHAQSHQVINNRHIAYTNRGFATYMAKMNTKDWNPSQYLKFEAERTRPSRDLLAQIPLKSPKLAIDLGCGPGNSTAVLAKHFSQSRVIGMDSSPNMIETARTSSPELEFEIGDLNSYAPKKNADLLFSNAVFQWIPRDERIPIIKKLIEALSPQGVFAFQVPDNFNEPTHQAMREVAKSGPWSKTLNGGEPARAPFQLPQELYDALQPLCSEVTIWHTHYYHVLENHEAIVEWVKGTGLRPFIDPLESGERDQFLEAYLSRIKQVYKSQQDGKVILKYPRLFLVAVRK